MSKTTETLSEELAVEERADAPVADESSEELEAQDAGDEEGEEAEGDEHGEEKPKRKGGFQRKIERLERERFEAQMQADEYRQALEQLSRQGQHPGQQQPQPQHQMPRLEDYDYDTERYQQAMQQWTVGTMQGYMQQQAAYQQQMAEQAQQQQRFNELQSRIVSATEKYPDFMVKVQDPSIPSLARVNPAAFEAVTESESFADVAYYLANNPSEIYAFRGLTPAQTVRRVAKLEAELGGGKRTVVPAAPKPPSTLKGGGPVQKDPNKMTTKEWLEWRNSDLRAKQNR